MITARLILIVLVLIMPAYNELLTLGTDPSTLLLLGMSAPAAVNPLVARPDSTVSMGWDEIVNATTAWDALNEVTANDEDGLYLAYPPGTPQTVELGLSDLVQPAAGIYTMWVRAKRELPNNNKLYMELWQGAVEIATSALIQPTADYADYSYQLSAAEVAAITDPTDLRVRLVGQVGSFRNMWVSYFALVVTPATPGRSRTTDSLVMTGTASDAGRGAASASEAGRGASTASDSDYPLP